jgi:hypothetical protein
MAYRSTLQPDSPSPSLAVTPAAVREPDAAHYIGRSRAYLKKARLVGGGPAFVRVNRAISYRIADLDRWLGAHVIDSRERA